jgi:hypothetical protein
MLTWIKIQAIRAQDLGHSAWDIVRNGKVAPFALSGMLALYSGVGIGLLFFKDDNRSDFSDEIGDAVVIHENGFGLDLPSDCDLDGRYYITLSKNGEVDLINDIKGYGAVPNNETQKYTAGLISNCFEEMALRLDNEADIDAVEDLSYAANVTYSDMALLHDSEDNEQNLGVDVVDAQLVSLEDRVENHNEYDENAEDNNISLYRAEFDVAQQRWASAAKQIDKKSDRDPYRDSDGAILNADQYARYDYDSLTFMELVKPMGIAFPLSFLFLCGVGTFNSSSFSESRTKRKDQIAYLKRTKGSSPIM